MISPVIFIMDNLLKVNRVVNLDQVSDFCNGGAYGEFPSFNYTEEIYTKLLAKQLKFAIECDVNIDEENLIVLCAQHDFGKFKLYSPKYMKEGFEFSFDAKLKGKNGKIKYGKFSLTQIVKLEDEGFELLEVYGKLSKKQRDKLNVTLVKGKNFNYYARG